jgi:small-conductance mechanosensitive channel
MAGCIAKGAAEIICLSQEDRDSLTAGRMQIMLGLILKLIVNVVALYAVVRLVPGISVTGFENLVFSSLLDSSPWL